MHGVKHLVQCHCMLPQFRNNPVPVFHKFIVFSIIDDEDQVISKVVECNNCGAVHKVSELGKSNIVIGREDLRSVITIQDIQLSLPDNVSQILKSYNADITTWEEVQFGLENEEWGKEIVLTREEVQGITQGKILKLVGPPSRIKIESFARDEFLG